MSIQHGHSLPQEWIIKEAEQGGSHDAFYILISDVIDCHFYHSIH